MLFRLILTALFFYFIWKVVRAFSVKSQQRPSGKGPEKPGAKKEFSNIQDAEFEDITPKDPGPKAKP